MSKAVKIIVGVAAAVAIPFVAPAVAKALGAAKLFTAIGLGAKAAGIAGTALAGAGLGAASAAAQGQNIGRGALFGGVASGAAAALQGVGAAAAAKSAGAPFTLNPINVAPVVGSPLAGTTIGAATAAGASGAGLAGALGGAATVAGTGIKTGLASALSKPLVAAGIGAAVGNTVAGPAQPAGGNLNSAQQNLAEVTAQDRLIFDTRFKGANELLGMADYANPEYAGLQSARRAMLQGAAARGDALRGKTGYRRDAESRRLDLDTARNVGTAFDTGFTGGFEQNVNARTEGLKVLPAPMQSRVDEYGRLQELDDARRRRRDLNLAGIGRLWGSLTNPAASVG